MSVTCSPNFWTGHRAGDLCLWYLEHDNSWRLLWQADVVQCIDGQMSDVGGHQLHSGYEGHLHPNHSGEYFEISQFFGKGEWGVILVILWRGGGGGGIYFGTFLKECIHYNFLLLYFICKLLCVCCLIKNNCKSTFLSLLPSSANVPDFFYRQMMEQQMCK